MTKLLHRLFETLSTSNMLHKQVMIELQWRFRENVGKYLFIYYKKPLKKELSDSDKSYLDDSSVR